MLKNGQGGIDWAGFPLLCGWIGISDLDGMLHRLATILTHRPAKD